MDLTEFNSQREASMPRHTTAIARFPSDAWRRGMGDVTAGVARLGTAAWRVRNRPVPNARVVERWCGDGIPSVHAHHTTDANFCRLWVAKHMNHMFIHTVSKGVVVARALGVMDDVISSFQRGVCRLLLPKSGCA